LLRNLILEKCREIFDQKRDAKMDKTNDKAGFLDEIMKHEIEIE